jgi:YD repeat-containing protein
MISNIIIRILVVSICLGSLGAAAQAGAITYVYDQLGRLKRVTYPSGAVIEYSYDANGNRTAYTVTGSTNPPPASPTLVGQGMTTTTLHVLPTNAPQQ